MGAYICAAVVAEASRRNMCCVLACAVIRSVNEDGCSCVAMFFVYRHGSEQRVEVKTHYLSVFFIGSA